MRIYDMDTELDFGKHRGKTIKELFDLEENNYVNWLHHKSSYVLSDRIVCELRLINFENEDIKRSFTLGNN